MHEFHLIHDLIKKIERIAADEKAPRVASAKVRLGALAHISADHFREHFEEASAGTVAEGAKLEIEEVRDENDPHAQDILLESVEVEQ